MGGFNHKCKEKCSFQVLSYAYFLKNDFNYEKVIAGVIPLRTFKNDFIPASKKLIVGVRISWK